MQQHYNTRRVRCCLQHPSLRGAGSSPCSQGWGLVPTGQGLLKSGRASVFPLLQHHSMNLRKCPRSPSEPLKKPWGHTLLLGSSDLSMVSRYLEGRNPRGLCCSVLPRPFLLPMLFRNACQMKCSHLKSLLL